MELVVWLGEASASDVATCLSAVNASCLEKLRAALEEKAAPEEEPNETVDQVLIQDHTDARLLSLGEEPIPLRSPDDLEKAVPELPPKQADKEDSPDEKAVPELPPKVANKEESPDDLEKAVPELPPKAAYNEQSSDDVEKAIPEQSSRVTDDAKSPAVLEESVPEENSKTVVAEEEARAKAEEAAKQIAEEEARAKAEEATKQIAEEEARAKVEDAAKQIAEEETKTAEEAKAKAEAERKIREEASTTAHAQLQQQVEQVLSPRAQAFMKGIMEEGQDCKYLKEQTNQWLDAVFSFDEGANHFFLLTGESFEVQEVVCPLENVISLKTESIDFPQDNVNMLNPGDSDRFVILTYEHSGKHARCSLLMESAAVRNDFVRCMQQTISTRAASRSSVEHKDHEAEGLQVGAQVVVKEGQSLNLPPHGIIIEGTLGKIVKRCQNGGRMVKWHGAEGDCYIAQRTLWKLQEISELPPKVADDAKSSVVLEKEIPKAVKAEEPKLLSLADELEALTDLIVDGKDYYKVGDKGRMSGEVYIDQKDGIERFQVTWYRTGLTSTMEKELWMQNFRFIGPGIKVPTIGYEIAALDVYRPTHYYSPGDRGKVIKEAVVTAGDGIERFEVEWYNSGLRALCRADVWLKNLRPLGRYSQEAAGPELSFDPAGKDPSLGDEMEVLPGISLTANGEECYGSGDRGRVSKDSYVDEKDSIEKFEVTWYRTGVTSTMKKDQWASNYRLTGKKLEVPNMGDEMECLPGHDLAINGKDYYKAGDRGRVSTGVYIDDKGCERIKLTWYRTGLTSTMKKEMWSKNFVFVAAGSRLPVLGQEVEALPFTNPEVYRPGDIGCVTKATDVMQGDGIERFAVMWYRTGLTSSEKKDQWLTSFYATGTKNRGVEMAVLQRDQEANLKSQSPKGKVTPASEPVPKREDLGCLCWEVLMEKKSDSARYGFSHSNGFEKFQKDRNKGRSDDNDTSTVSVSEDGPQTLIVKRIAQDGLLNEWNQLHPDAAVRSGDRIVEVNGRKDIADMQDQLRASAVKMSVVRYAWYFNIDLKKREGARKYGFKFEKPHQSLDTLKITEVAPDGLLEEMNQRMIAEGRSHLAVTVGMHIEAVNDVVGSSLKIADVLRKAEAVSMRVCRYDIAEKRRKKQMAENLTSQLNLGDDLPTAVKTGKGA